VRVLRNVVKPFEEHLKKEVAVVYSVEKF
jgi:hypothetical protein